MTTKTRFLRDTVMNMISCSHSLRAHPHLHYPRPHKEVEDKLFFAWRRAWTEEELDTETLWKMAHLVAHRGTSYEMAWQAADAITLELDPSFVPTRLPVN